MNSKYECPREFEVLDALALKGGLQADAALQAHVDGCPICRDVVAVALPLLQEGQRAIEGAQPPTSGVVWWRAQMRARQEAARAATRPITVVQGLALASFVAVFAAALGAVAPRVAAWFGSLETLSGFDVSLPVPQFDLAALMPSSTFGMFMAGLALLFLLVGPLAVYFAFGDE